MVMLYSRRAILGTALAAMASHAAGSYALAQKSSLSFEEWRRRFRKRAVARGILPEVYDRVMDNVKPDTSVYGSFRSQPEFREKPWQYLNRRVSDWRIATGKQRAKEHAGLLGRIEKKYGVDRYLMLGLWGMESAFGDLVDNPKHMKPVFPSLSALAWGEPRRRAYWQQELLNALVIVQRGWSTPKEMVGSWAGAMGHTQWMPEVWLNIGVDFDGNGGISPFQLGDAFAGTARYMRNRGDYRPGQRWGYEVRLPQTISPRTRGTRTIADWRRLGVKRANGEAFPNGDERARLWQPDKSGPVFLLTANFFALKSYNPSNLYALAICSLADQIAGGGGFVQQFPSGERILTLDELQEIQKQLTALGYDTGGTDGRVGQTTMRAVRDFQVKAGIEPADGYPGLKVLARLRKGL
jgi:membrane-bound lytic murein transglycosylase B